MLKMATMRQIILILTIWFFLTSFSQKDSFIDPTGTYKLDSKIKKVGDDTFGYFGEIRLKKLTKNRIVMTFSICKGAPSYNSGSFIDTLEYVDNKSVYKADFDIDPSCEILFYFNEKGVSVKEKTDDYNCGCGFGHAVVADGFYKKISSKQPELRNPMTDEKIE